MKQVLFILTLCLLAISCNNADLSGVREHGVYQIRFVFHHSRRIPNHSVIVNIDRSGDDVFVFVESIPSDTVSAKWKVTKKEYVFALDMNRFNRVVMAVKRINCLSVENGLDVVGVDGTTCEIEMKGLSSAITYKVWSPNYKTMNRNLQQYLNACKEILKTAKLDPNDIL